jgi:hypothetical protein
MLGCRWPLTQGGELWLLGVPSITRRQKGHVAHFARGWIPGDTRRLRVCKIHLDCHIWTWQVGKTHRVRKRSYWCGGSVPSPAHGGRFLAV